MYKARRLLKKNQHLEARDVLIIDNGFASLFLLSFFVIILLYTRSPLLWCSLPCSFSRFLWCAFSGDPCAGIRFFHDPRGLRDQLAPYCPGLCAHITITTITTITTTTVTTITTITAITVPPPLVPGCVWCSEIGCHRLLDGDGRAVYRR